MLRMTTSFFRAVASVHVVIPPALTQEGFTQTEERTEARPLRRRPTSFDPSSPHREAPRTPARKGRVKIGANRLPLSRANRVAFQTPFAPAFPLRRAYAPCKTLPIAAT